MGNDLTGSPVDEETLFRYQVISTVLSSELSGWRRPQAVLAAVTAAHHSLGGGARDVSERSIYRWLKAYEADGLPGLISIPRQGAGTRCISPEVMAFFVAQKEADPHASIPELIDRAKELGFMEGVSSISRVSVWRALNRQGVSTRRTASSKADKCRRFAYPHRMDMVLCDGKHFRAGKDRRRRVALIFIDDATRCVLDVAVGTSEKTELFLRGLYQCLRRHGRMRTLFVDNGSGFISHATLEVAAKLGIHLVHGTRAYPEGHGKIERFNRTLLQKMLRLLAGKAEIDPDCEALEIRIRHFLDHHYNRTVHESLNGLAPLDRFTQDKCPLVYLQPEEIHREFVVWKRRRVSKDHVVNFDGVAYETPIGYRRKTAQLQYHLLDQTISMIHDERLVRLEPVDLCANAHRAQIAGAEQPEEPTAPLPPGSAEMSFKRDTGAVVDAQGNFFKKD